MSFNPNQSIDNNPGKISILLKKENNKYDKTQLSSLQVFDSGYSTYWAPRMLDLLNRKSLVKRRGGLDCGW